MKKHISKKGGLAISLALILTIASVIPFPVKAGVVDESTYSSAVEGTDKTYFRTIATNYHAGNMLGLVSVSNVLDMESAARITAEEKGLGYEPVLFVDDFKWDSDERKLIQKKAEELSATIVSIVDIQLFRWEASSFVSVNDSAIPVKLIAGIPKTCAVDNDVLRDYREYAMIRVHNGEVTILKDLDDDLKTLTFETDKFSAFGLIYTGKGVIDDYLANTTDTVNAKPSNEAPSTANQGSPAPASSGELDDVPKTGDILYEIEYGYYK